VPRCKTGSPGGQPGSLYHLRLNPGRKAVFDLSQRSPHLFELSKLAMKAFLYECPTQGLQVQGWVEEENSSHAESNHYIAVKCPLCTRTHFVNPGTGHALGSDRKPTTK
jgi:hypothetical protein